jgi:hypothetical protein
MEPLPRGANFLRAKMLWEIGLHIAGDPNEPYTGNRDICISVGSGSGERHRPWLRLACGSPILAQAVVHGELEGAFVNPSGFVTQAYRGTGLFSTPLPVRILASYPSWDRYVHVVHPRTGLTSLAQIKEQKYPLRLSIREDPTHSTRVLNDQVLAIYGFSLAELQSWGGTLQTNGGPGDERRLRAIEAGEIDAIFDEGLVLWFDQALAAGMAPLDVEDWAWEQLQAMGWRRALIPAGPTGRFPHLQADHYAIDYSAGRCTRGRRCRTTTPTRSSPPWPRVPPRSPGKTAPIRGSPSSGRTPRRRRWTCRSIPGPRAGTASTASRSTRAKRWIHAIACSAAPRLARST